MTPVEPLVYRPQIRVPCLIPLFPSNALCHQDLSGGARTDFTLLPWEGEAAVIVPEVGTMWDHLREVAQYSEDPDIPGLGPKKQNIYGF